LARWVGLAIAFEHNPNLAKIKPPATNLGRTLFDVFNSIMEESAALAWHGKNLPDWTEDLFDSVRDGIHPDEIKFFRPWNDVQKNLTTILSSFSQYTKTSYPSENFTQETLEACMALKLLAAVEPGQVSDQIVGLVEWVEKNIETDPVVEEIRGLIHVEWERSLLQRVTNDGAEGKSIGRRRKL
jgi:hypothetical protein